MAILKSGRARLEFLDMARGLAALLILLEHGFYNCFPGYLEFATANIVVGQAGILVFFMISGFVIPLSMEDGSSIATFWTRRFFRLFPVYWFSIALAYAYLACGGPLTLDVGLSDTKTWIANIALLQGIFGRPNVWGVFWSLHFEIAFYVICTVLFASGLLRRIGAKTFLLLPVAFGIACTVKLVRTKNPTDDMYYWLIALSAMAGLLAHRYVGQRISRRSFFGLLAGLFGVFLSIWGLNHLMYPTVATFEQLARSAVVGGLGFGGFVWLVEARHRKMPQFACWLGRRSYSIYLLHPFVLLFLIPTGWPAWAFMPCLVGSTLLFAELTHRIVERPGIALGRRLEKRRKPAEAAPAIENNPVQLAA